MRETSHSAETNMHVEYPLPQEALMSYKGDFQKIMHSDMASSEKTVEISNMDTEARLALLALYKHIEAVEKDLN